MKEKSFLIVSFLFIFLPLFFGSCSRTVEQTADSGDGLTIKRGYVDHYRFGVFPGEDGGNTIVRLDKLIKNLVELARTEETVKENAAACFSISEVAQANADAFRPLAEADGRELTVEITDGLTLKGVQDNFFRLFSILLDNAVKYCDPKGIIRLCVSQRGKNIYIVVSNPCAGINAAQLPRYFDRFYRADSSRARSTGGYGIGLSTAKAIVTRHKGRISNHYADGVIVFTAVIPQGS